MPYALCLLQAFCLLLMLLGVGLAQIDFEGDQLG